MYAQDSIVKAERDKRKKQTAGVNAAGIGIPAAAAVKALASPKTEIAAAAKEATKSSADKKQKTAQYAGAAAAQYDSGTTTRATSTQAQSQYASSHGGNTAQNNSPATAQNSSIAKASYSNSAAPAAFASKPKREKTPSELGEEMVLMMIEDYKAEQRAKEKRRSQRAAEKQAASKKESHAGSNYERESVSYDQKAASYDPNEYRHYYIDPSEQYEDTSSKREKTPSELGEEVVRLVLEEFIEGQRTAGIEYEDEDHTFENWDEKEEKSTLQHTAAKGNRSLQTEAAVQAAPQASPAIGGGSFLGSSTPQVDSPVHTWQSPVNRPNANTVLGLTPNAYLGNAIPGPYAAISSGGSMLDFPYSGAADPAYSDDPWGTGQDGTGSLDPAYLTPDWRTMQHWNSYIDPNAMMGAMQLGSWAGNKFMQLANDTHLAPGTSLDDFLWDKAKSGVYTGVEGAYNGTLDLGTIMEKARLEQAKQDLLIPMLLGREWAINSYDLLQNIQDTLPAEAARYYSHAAAEYAQQIDEMYQAGGFFKLGGDVASSIGQMVPTIVVNILTGPAGSMSYMYLSASGNAAAEARANGADEETALLYGMLSGSVEVLTEQLGDAVAGLDKGKLNSWLMGMVQSDVGRTALKQLMSALGEGAEEFISEIAGAYLAQMWNGDERGAWDTFTGALPDAFYSGFVGTLTSAIMEIPSDLSELNNARAADSTANAVQNSGSLSDAQRQNQNTQQADQSMNPINAQALAEQNARIRQQALENGKAKGIELDTAERLLKTTGLKLQYIYAENSGVDGFISGDTVTVNLASETSAFCIAVHEAGHSMKINNAKGFDAFQVSVQRVIENKPELKQYAERIRADYTAENSPARASLLNADGTVNTAALEEDVCLKTFEQLIKDPEQLTQAVAHDRTAIESFLDVVRGIKNSLVIKFTGSEKAMLDEAERTLTNLLRGEAGTVEGGRFSYVGENANLNDDERRLLQEAKDRVANGEDPEKVRQATNWFIGTDGKWRMEVDDSVAQYFPNGNAQGAAPEQGAQVRDFLIHPELERLEPSLFGLPMQVDPAMDPGINGRYRGSAEGIFIRDGATVNTVLHELQHGIQEIEGFTRGSSSNQGAQWAMIVAYEQVKDTPEYQVIQDKDVRYQYVLNKALEITGTQKIKDAGFVYYANAPGEVEARDTANRTNLTASERLDEAPDLSGNPRYAEFSLLKYIDMLRKMGYANNEILERMRF